MTDDKIIDTNVPLTAVGMHEGVSIACQQACIKLIKGVLNGNIRVFIDAEGEIVKEYRRKMHPDPNPSAGLASQFLMYIINNRGNPALIYEVSLPRREDGEYEDFPDDARLIPFDRSDRKWVALSINYQRNTKHALPIVNATDSDWLRFVQVLGEFGIVIEFICS